jgi:hypothetical protein
VCVCVCVLVCEGGVWRVCADGWRGVEWGGVCGEWCVCGGLVYPEFFYNEKIFFTHTQHTSHLFHTYFPKKRNLRVQIDQKRLSYEGHSQPSVFLQSVYCGLVHADKRCPFS